MSFFSPITERSATVRFLFASIYGLLILGALTMVLPLLVTVTGSTSGPYDAQTFSFYPRFLFKEEALWGRYVDAKYGGSLENFAMATNSSSVDFYAPVYPVPPAPPEQMKLWQEFKAEHGPLKGTDAGLSFTRMNKRDAGYHNRNFRIWLLDQYGSLDKLNEALSIQVVHSTSIIPPVQARVFKPDTDSALTGKFLEYLETVPESHRLIWNVGNFYRSVYLVRLYGEASDVKTEGADSDSKGGIEAYNKTAGTQYHSYSEIPFPGTAPEGGASVPWFSFVKKLLNPSFVELTPSGEAARIAAGMSKKEFISIKATAQDVRVRSIDIAFAEWAAKRGVADARIPQMALDWENFQNEKGFWRWRFVCQNYLDVIDEVLIQGNGVKNTLILIGLSVLGALTINPMAAYALSRYKLPQSYHVLLFFLATIAFPAEVAMIPNFLQLKEFGLLNTFGALVLPGLVNGFSIFLLKGFFDSLPKELYEAADIDGASEWQIFWGITMNLSRPILAVIALGAFISAYGAFFFALILAPDPEMWTLMVWIYQLRQSAGPGIIYASLLITAVPTLIVFLCAQNVILRGIVVPSDK